MSAAKDTRKDMLWRVYLVYLGILIFGIAIIGKVIHIQFVEGDYLRKKAEQNSLRYFPIEEIRGSLLACDGSMLATSVPIFDVRMDMGSNYYDEEFFKSKVDSLCWCISKLFNDKSKSEYKRLIMQGWEDKDRFLLLKRNATYPQLKKLRTFPIFNLGRYKGGLVAVPKSRREMPFKNLAARTIGFERPGYKVGLEGGYSEYLEGVSGKRLMRKLNNGAWMPVSNKNEIEPKDGYDVVTTIDINIQDVAEDALMRCLQANEADHGCAILMEVATGHIKAIANLSRMGDDTYQETLNYAIQEASEPGSTFKLASLLVAIEDGYVKLTDTVDTEGGTHFFCNQQMNDSHKGIYGRVSVKKAFEVSSNVGISKIIYKHYHDQQQKFIDGLNRIGISKALGIDLPGEVPPNIKGTSSKVWTDCYSLAWMSVGYELAITPLQTLSYYNAVANNGVFVRPMFVQEIHSGGVIIRSFEPVVLNKSIGSKETIAKARELLEGVVKEGTGKNLFSPIYQIAGKTGTAQIATPGEGYDHVNYKASFVGYFPADNPKFSCIVVVNNPSKGAYYGGAVAAPVFKEIADKVYATSLEIHQVKQQTPTSSDLPVVRAGHRKDIQTVYSALAYPVDLGDPSSVWLTGKKDSTSTKISYVSKQVYRDVVPDVYGMGIKDAVYLLESMGMKVRVSGKGKIKKQTPAAGTKINGNNLIILELATS